MLSRQVLLAVLAAMSVSAVPLNINLGAYSPALVVGDGEISFGGSPERASEILQTLASGASNGPAGAQAVPRPGMAAMQPGAAGPAIPAIAPALAPAPAAAPAAEGLTSPLVTPAAAISQVPDINTNAPAIAVEGAGSSQPTEFISHAITGTKYPNMVKRSVVNNDPRVTVAKQRFRRDLAGFREALAFARDAQKNQPKVELGFGITQNAGINVPTNSAANGALPPGGVAPREKRDVSPEEPAKLGMTLIAISEI